MSSKVADVAAAVVTALNEAGSSAFSQTFSAVRKYLPLADLKDLAGVAVTVVPKSMARENAARDSVRRDILIDIGVQKRLKDKTTDPADPARLAELDQLMQLVEEIAEFFEPGQIGNTGYRWSMTEIPDPMFDQNHLRELHAFTSVVTVTFRNFS